MDKITRAVEINRVRKVITNCIDSAEEDGMVLVYEGHGYRDTLTRLIDTTVPPICGCLIGCILGDVPTTGTMGLTPMELPVRYYEKMAAERLGVTTSALTKIENGFEGSDDPNYRWHSPADELWYNLGRGFRSRAVSRYEV